MRSASRKFLMNSKSHTCYRAASLAMILLCLISSICSAHAQRTMKGQGILTAGATSGITRMLDMGAEVGYGQYLLRGYWYTAASVASHKIRTSGAYLMRYIDLLGGGGYMHRLVSTRSRSISLYAGGGAFLGYEIYDPAGELPSSISTGLAAGSFLYGISARAEVEFFITGRLAVSASVCAPVNFSSPVTLFRPALLMSLRYNI